MNEVKFINENIDDLKKIVKELEGASKMHKDQSVRIQKYLDDMKETVNEKKNPKREKVKKDFKTSLNFAKGAIRKIETFMKSDYWGMADRYVTDKRTGLVSIVKDMEKSMNQIIKMPVDESVNEAGMELNKLKDAIKMFQKKIKKQGRVTNARDEEHLKNLIKVYKQMGGKGVKESVNEGKKRYYQQDRVGSAKYTISYHDGKKKHKDGSDFFDIKTFRNKKDLAKFVNTLSKSGYVYGFNEYIKEALPNRVWMDLRKQYSTNELKRFFKKESVNEIFPKGAGKKISKAMQKGIEPQGNIKKVLDVAKNQQSKKIGGTLVDLTTANLMTQVWNKVNDKSKEKMNKMNAKQLTNLILKLWDRVGTPRV